MVRKGLPAIPVLTTGLLILPVLAIFPPLSDYADARYSLPFLPQMLMGLGAWLLLLPARARSSPWLVAVLPTVWALAFALPQLHHSVGWTVSDPDAPPSSVVRELDSRGIRYLGGNYWGVYVVDYFADGDLIVKARYRCATDRGRGRIRSGRSCRHRVPLRRGRAAEPRSSDGPLRSLDHRRL